MAGFVVTSENLMIAMASLSLLSRILPKWFAPFISLMASRPREALSFNWRTEEESELSDGASSFAKKLSQLISQTTLFMARFGPRL